MQGRRLGNWLKQRQDATLDYTEPEEGEADAPGTEWHVDPEIVREQRLRRLRWTIIATVAVLLVVSGTWLLLRRATAYQRLVRDTFSKNIDYVEYQPFAGSAFIKVDDPSIYPAIRDWFAESASHGSNRMGPPACQLRVVFADGSTKVFMIDPTGPSLGPDDTVVPPMTAVAIEVDGFKRWAWSQPFHNEVYARLATDRQLAKGALPATVTVPGGRTVMTAMGSGEARATSSYDAAMDAARHCAQREALGQALLALQEARHWMPDSIEAQELAAIARTQLRFHAPRIREQVAALIDESPERFDNRATYHRVRADLLKLAWMFPPDDAAIHRLRERFAARRLPADPSRFREVRRLEGAASDLHAVRTLLWSPDGTRIAAACSDAFIRIWDATSGRLLRRIPAPSIESLAFSADGRYLLAGRNGLTELSRADRTWDVLTCEPATVQTDQPAAMTSFNHPDGIVTTSNEFGEVQLRDSPTHEVLQTLSAHAGPVRIARFAPDGDALLTFADDKTAIIWSDGQADDAAPLDDNRFRSMRRLATLPGPGILTGDGRIIVIPRDGDRSDAQGPAPSALPLTPIHLKHPLRDLRLSTDGKLVLVVTESGEAIVLDIETGAERHRCKPPATGGIAVAPDGGHVAYGAPDGSIHVVEAASGSEAHVLTTTAAVRNWSTLDYSADGRLILARAGAACAVWEVATGINWFHTDRLSSADARDRPATLSADGKRFAVSRHREVFEIITADTFDATVRVRRAAVTSFSFSPDARLLAAAGPQGEITIHDTSSGAVLQTIPLAQTNADPAAATASIRAMRFSPDANTLLIDPADGSLRLIDVTAATELRRLPWPEHLGPPHPLSFSPDSTRVLTGTILWGSPE